MGRHEGVRSQDKVREPTHPDRPTLGAKEGLAPDLQALLSLQHLAGNAAVQQLIRGARGPTVQRDAATGEGVSYPAPLTGKRRALYERKLKWVIPKLGHIRFPSDKPKFDEDYWWPYRDPKGPRRFQFALALKSKEEPAQAIQALVAKPQKWSLDCAMWVQVAEIYALASAMGFAAFNRLRSPLLGGNEFLLRAHLSTGVRRHLQWTRSSPKGRIVRTDERGRSQPEKRSMDDIVATAPVGARVAWTASLVVDRAWSNENAIKVGSDKYAAHGFEPKMEFTRKEMEAELLKKSREALKEERRAYLAPPSEAQISESVFLSQVEEYQVP